MNATNSILGGLGALVSGLLLWRGWLWLADRRFRRDLDANVQARMDAHVARDWPLH